jgi:ABC-type amino acid transport substrate-binding protein
MQRVRSAALSGHRTAVVTSAIALLVAPLVLAQQPSPSAPASTSTLNRIRDVGRLKLGYRPDARPFSYRDGAGQAAGYSVALCQKVADEVRGELKLTGLAIEWVPVSLNEGFGALRQGGIDLLCGADAVTLARRTDVAFSLPTFPGGIGALLRADAPARLREVLAGRGQTFRPNWRASAGQVLQARTFAAVAGTTGEKWLADRVTELHVIADVATVNGYDAGIQALLDRKSDVLFGERAILLDASRRHPSARELTVVDRLFSYEPLAFALARGDEDFRLLVDRALSRFYRSGEIGGLYASTFGEPDENALTFFRWNALPE